MAWGAFTAGTDLDPLTTHHPFLPPSPLPPEDGCEAEAGDYNNGLTVASIFIIFTASLLGAMIPAFMGRSQRPAFDKTVKMLAYAGAGVLLSTGFMHLLLPAQTALTSPCLSESFLGRYPSWAFLFCVIAIACMQVLDYFVTVKIAGRAPPSLAADGDEPSGSTRPVGAIASDHSHSHGPSSSPSVAGFDDADAAEAGVCVVHAACHDAECGGHALLKPKAPTLKSQVAAVFMSEASIAVHSVLIGITLGVTHGDEIVPLLIALTFHQFLEGVAIGSAAVYAGMAPRTVAALGLIFAVTTPVGIAIGLGVRGAYNGSSSAALITQGTLDAVCAGMLIFLALGDHVNAVKSQAHWLKREGTVTHTVCIGAFLGGVALMCTLALWV